MSISYCALFSRDLRVVLAESTKGESMKKNIINLFGEIYKENCEFRKTLTIEIEADSLILTYYAEEKYLLACVSKLDDGYNRPFRFIDDRFKELTFKYIIPITGTMQTKNTPQEAELCCQSLLVDIYNRALDDFETGIYTNKGKISKLSKNLENIKTELKRTINNITSNQNEISLLEEKSKNIKSKAIEYEETAKILEYETRYIKPWVWITGIVIVVAVLSYCIVALIRCGELNIFCKTVKEKYNEDFGHLSIGEEFIKDSGVKQNVMN